MHDHHVIEVLHTVNGFSPVAVYAHCTCEWVSNRFQLTGTKLDGTDVAVLAAEREGHKHVEQSSSLHFPAAGIVMASHPVPCAEPDPSACMGPLPAWRMKAACLDEDPELFFPKGTTGHALEQIEQAKAVCNQCPVIDECLEWALDSNQDSGVWGGRSEEERRSLRRKRGRRDR
jgi:WhiB family transcriptional regulator, redox-sensing transcriptional regulator